MSSSEPVPPANAVAADPAARAATPAPARKERRERVMFRILSSHKLAGGHPPRCSRLASGTSHHSGSPGAIRGVAWRLMYVQYTSPSRALQPVGPRHFTSLRLAGGQLPRCMEAHVRPVHFAPMRLAAGPRCIPKVLKPKTLVTSHRAQLPVLPKLRIRSRALCGEDQQRGSIREHRETMGLTAVPGPYRAGRTACRTRHRGSGRASRSCRCWRRSRRS